MNLLNSTTPIAVNERRWSHCLERLFRHLSQKPISNAAQKALINTLRRRVNWSDSAKMNRNFIIILDHLKFRVIDTYSFAAQTRLAEHHELLTGRDHLSHIVQVEPTADQRLAQCVRVCLLQGRFKNLLPTSETPRSEEHTSELQSRRD